MHDYKALGQISYSHVRGVALLKGFPQNCIAMLIHVHVPIDQYLQ